MEMVRIYFDTATFDLIEKDTKNTLETQISVIGGTMGLFSGFSILSAVEILYFTVKYFMALRNKKNLAKNSIKFNKNIYTGTLKYRIKGAHRITCAQLYFGEKNVMGS